MPRFKKILEKRGKRPTGSPIRSQGGTTADQTSKPRGAPTPGVRKAQTKTRGQPQRGTEPKPGEKFRSLMNQRGEEEKPFGMKKTDAGAPGEEQRPGVEAETEMKKHVPGEEGPEVGPAEAPGQDVTEAPDPEGTPQDQAKEPWEKVDMLPASEDDAGKIEAADAKKRVEAAEPELGELPPQEQRRKISEDMMKQDISNIVDEMEGPPEKPMRIQMNRMPQGHEMASLTKGSIVNTPYGDVTKDGTGQVSVTFSPLMQEKLRQRRKVEVKMFGEFPGSTDPNSPPPPINPGRRSFNPFTGNFVNNENSVLEKYMKKR